jgi:hypothetical protein
MWSDLDTPDREPSALATHDTSTVDLPPAPTPAERMRANREIRLRGLCPHHSYSGTDPITGVVLCPTCRRTGQHTPAYRRPAPRPRTERSES